MTFTIDGKQIEIAADATVTVEVGRYRNAYKIRNTFSGEQIAQAWMIYDAINIGKGYKKRLRVNGVTVASYRDTEYLLRRGTPPHDAATATGMYDHY